MNIHDVKHVHLIGIGGINMSAVAKILLHAKVEVSGSDLIQSEQTDALIAMGAKIAIGESSNNVPLDAELVIYTSAAQTTNKERIVAGERGIPEMTNFTFLGQWFSGAREIVVTGTHGKSTTTAMLGLMLQEDGKNPTVVIGSKVPGFQEGNVRIGDPNLFVVEGDEYARHFLEFHPDALILNNLELDHTDVFHSIDSLISSFHELMEHVKPNGIVVANAADARIARIIETERDSLLARGVHVILFGPAGSTMPADAWEVKSYQEGDARLMSVSQGSEIHELTLAVPGEFNALNAAAAFLLGREMGVDTTEATRALAQFHGIWRRFEHVGDVNGVPVISDYGHHPTAVEVTLKAAHETFPNHRIVLCFQPHHRNRTKSLFLEFIPSFDLADALIMCEIFDVPGREGVEDADVTSRDLVDAITRHDADRGAARTVEFAADPTAAVKRTMEIVKPGDVVIVMGAGDIDSVLRKTLKGETTPSAV